MLFVFPLFYFAILLIDRTLSDATPSHIFLGNTVTYVGIYDIKCICQFISLTRTKKILTFSVGLKIHWLYIRQRSTTLSTQKIKEGSGYETKLHQMECVEYPVIVITPSTTLILIVMIPSIYLYIYIYIPLRSGRIWHKVNF